MAKKQDKAWLEKLEIFDKLVDLCPRFERKGKNMIYTSANGHMFSFLNKDGEIGFRYSKEVQEKYFEKYKTTHLMSHGSVLKGYIKIPEEMLSKTKTLVRLLNESYDYVMSLDPK